MFEENSFIPTAKLKNNKKFSILADHLGTPTSMYNEEGETLWERSLDGFGRVLHGDNRSCPFMYQGQYYDKEIELAYNRFRYYDCSAGVYISQDPIGLAGGDNFYAYVKDVNLWTDVLGLKGGINPLSTIDLKPGTDHVLERHYGNDPNWDHKSKWTGETRADWKTTSRDTFRNPDRIVQSGDRFIYEKTYKKPVGVDPNGVELKKVRVVVEADGKLVTAFPQENFKELTPNEKVIKCG